MTRKFISINCGGNLHEVVSYVNTQWWSKYVMQFFPISSGSGCIVVVRINDPALYVALWNELGYKTALTIDLWTGKIEEVK